MKKELNIIKTTLVIILKGLARLVGAIVKLAYLITKALNNLGAKLFNKLPRLLKVITIYTMIILSVLQVISMNSVNAKQVEKVIVKTEIVEIEKTEIIEEQVEEIVEIETCKFENETACAIYNKGLENGLTKEQSTLLVAISAHETGYWTSKAFTNNNNFGGLMNPTTDTLQNYETFENGLNAFVNCLTKYYFNKGLNTIEEIGAKYCPVGAKNDPNGLNKNWVNGVSSIYSNYLAK